jgi:hypothetical protein
MPFPNKQKKHLKRVRSLAAAANAERAAKRVNNKQPKPEAGELPRGDHRNGDETEFSSHESSSDESSSDELSSEESGAGEDGETDKTDSNCPQSVIKWSDGAGKNLRSLYKTGSISTRTRERKRQRELDQEASKTLSIVSFFKRQRDLGISMKNNEPSSITTPLSAVGRGEARGNMACHLALEDLERLLKLKTEQVKKYGHVLFPQGDFYRRHLMVRSFLWMQEQKDKLPKKDRRGIAEMVAASFNRRSWTGRKIVRWERHWMKNRTIPESKAGKHRACLSWLEDEGVLCAVRDFAKTQGEG